VAIFTGWDKQMLRVSCVITALLTVMLLSAAPAQKSSGHMDLNEKSRLPGTQLVVFRVMFSETEAICPRQTGIFRIASNGSVTDIVAVLRRFSPDWRMDATAASDDFTYRRRVALDSCRIDIDIGEQQQRNGEWIPLVYPFARGADAIIESARKTDSSLPFSTAQIEALNRDFEAGAHAGNLRQGVTATFKDALGFEGARDCFDAVGTYLIDQTGVVLLFPIGLGGELNRFFVERVDADTDHSTLYLSRGSCRVAFTISASISREGSWVPLPVAPFK
jgi:hypothetical protein